MNPAITVVGSGNLDIVITVPRFPRAGETLLGFGYSEVAGGKGANQAMAAARVASTSFVGAVGRDAAGSLLVERLARESVSIEDLQFVDIPTGRAIVSVTPEGENAITVLPLANGTLEHGHVIAALEARVPHVVICQLEIPLIVVEEVARWTVSRGARFILNPSPVAALAPMVIAAADPLILNTDEAESLLSLSSGDHVPRELALQLLDMARSVVVTSGAQGAWVAEGGIVQHVAGIAVHARDTTGAGDAFAGTLAAHLAIGASLFEAAQLANAEAARLVQLNRADR